MSPTPPRSRPMRASIRTKLFAGFGAVLVLLLAATLLALHGMGSIIDRSDKISEGDVPSLAIAGQLAQANEQYRLAQTSHTLSSDPKLMAVREQNLKDAAAAVDKGLLQARTLTQSAADRAALDEFASDWKKYLSVSADVVPLSRAGKKAAAIAILNEQRDPFIAIRTAVAKWSAIKQQLSKADADEADSAFGSAKSLLVALGLLAVATGAGIAFLLSRSIASRTHAMLKAADGIAQGDVDQQVEIKGGDELAKTGAAFSRMIEYLREMTAVTEQVARGDLTAEVHPRSERDLLGTALDKLVTDLRTMIGDVTASAGTVSAGTVSAASQQMAATSDEAGRAVGEIAQAVTDVAQGAERQVRMVEQTRETASETARVAQ